MEKNYLFLFCDVILKKNREVIVRMNIPDIRSIGVVSIAFIVLYIMSALYTNYKLISWNNLWYD
jgi:hypothetical protein